MLLSRLVTSIFLLALVLAIVGCPRARVQDVSGTVTVNCPPGARCTRTVSGTIRITFPFSEFSANDEYAGILDLSNEWIPVDTPASSARIKLIDSSGGFVEDEFELVRVEDTTVSAVDKDTTPVVFAYADPSEVDAFFSNNLSFFDNENDIVEMTFLTTIERVQCQTPTGKYPTHLRYLDSNGITFFTTLQFNYTEPENYHQGCDEGSLVIEY